MLRNSRRVSRLVQRSLTVLVLLVAGVATAFGQIDRGTITGTVRDSSGAVIPNANVQIVQIETNTTIDLSTNGEGLFFAPNLPPSVYRIVIKKEGFTSSVREPVQVIARNEVKVDTVLQLGAVSDTVNVSAEAPILDTAAVNNSTTFGTKLFSDLPLISVGIKRDITNFLANMPGTTSANVFVPTVNASAAFQTEGFVDGAPASEMIVKGAMAETGPMIESVSEVSVVTNAFNAEYGGFGNWFTNVTIKSGTNQLHGSVFDHFGNSDLNARNSFLPFRTPYNQHEGGFTVGGPVVIPHIYDGKNKTFFFGSLGLFFSRAGAGGIKTTIPTPAFLTGDFSGLTAGNGSQIPIFDPASTAPDGKGSFTRNQFTGNVIPVSQITQAGRTLATLWPAPDLPGNFNNYFDRSAGTPGSNSLGLPIFNLWTPLIKIDHSISNKQKLQFSATGQQRHRVLWGSNGFNGAGIGRLSGWGQKQTDPLGWETDQVADEYQIRLNHDYVVSPTLLNHINANVNREWNIGLNKTIGQGWDQKLGFTGIPNDLGEFPQISFQGGTASPIVLNRGYDEFFHDYRADLGDNLTWIRGKHTMKFGVNFERAQVSRDAQGGSSGIFTFASNMTSLPDSPSYGSWGNSYASFLLGAVNSANALIPVPTTIMIPRYALFAQDEWRVNSKLTISYGLRWDYQPPFTERYNKISSFVPTLVNPGAGGRLGALGFAGTGPGTIGSRNFFSTWHKGFAPRLGIAYQMNPKTVIRAASGIYYTNWSNTLNPNSRGFDASPTFSSPDGFTPVYNYATQSFPQTYTKPPSLDPTFLNGQSIAYYQGGATRLPQILNWTFSIQRELAPNLSVEATYLGSKSTHLGFNENDNYMPLSGLQYGSTLLSNINSPAAAAAGFSSPYPAFASQLGANTVYQSLRPYPQYTAVTTTFAAPDGVQKFNSLQVKGTKRFSGGLSIFGFVTWTKSFSLVTDQYPGSRLMQLDANPALVFSTSFSYDLPFGKGKQLLASSSRAVNAVVSGWKVSGFVKYNSGAPLSISAAAGTLSAVGYSQRGNAVSGVSPYITTNPGDFTPTSKYLNAAAFQASTGFNFGNLAPNLSWVRGFWGKQESLSVARTFSIVERLKLDLSLDASNPFNFHRWGAPNTSLLSSAFGTVSSVADPRTMQINAALKF